MMGGGSFWLAVAAVTAAACSGGDDGPSSASSTIGPEGGMIEVDGAILDVPEGALLEPVEIQIDRTSEAAPVEYTAWSPVYRFEPAGLTFSSPAEVTILVSGEEGAVQLFWTGTDGSTYAPSGGTFHEGLLVGQVSHFSRGFAGTIANTGGGPDAGPPRNDGGDGQSCEVVGCAIGEVCQAGVCIGDGDGDGDGVYDSVDNCPDVKNADQADADEDELGDACEPYQCSDGLDNDDDTYVDELDPGCTGPTDTTEYTPTA